MGLLSSCGVQASVVPHGLSGALASVVAVGFSSRGGLQRLRFPGSSAQPQQWCMALLL